MRALVEETLSAASASVRVREIQEALATQFPEEPRPGIASVRRIVRGWREERDESGDRKRHDERPGWKASLIRNQREQIRILESEEAPDLSDDFRQCLLAFSRAVLESLEADVGDGGTL